MDFTVRKSKVLNALLYLKTNNPAYNDIEIDEEVINSLPEGGLYHQVQIEKENV